jgi:all-trans-8'-apo-beta-carotenal 15,15'-oxygenase
VSSLHCLRTLKNEYNWKPVQAEGRLPSDLNFTAYRVGAGKFEAYGRPYKHWFDGEGAVAALRVRDGKAWLASRLIVPPNEEEERKKELLFGRFGQAPKGIFRRLHSVTDNKMFFNSANTALLSWQHKLYALWEAGLPTQLDPETLGYLGQKDLGVIKRSFSAHPKRHAKRKAWINFGVTFFPSPELQLYELNDDGEAKLLRSVPFGGQVFLHDFAVTENYAIFLCSPLFLGMRDFLIYGRGLAESMKYKPEQGLSVLVVPFDTNQKPQTLEHDACVITHFAQAFESNSEIVIDAIAYDDDADFRRLATMLKPERAPISHGRLKRFRIGRNSVFLEQVCAESLEVPQKCLDGNIVCAGYSGKTSQILFDSLYLVDSNSGKVKSSRADGHAVSEALQLPCGKFLTLNYDPTSDRSYWSLLSNELERETAFWLDHYFPFTFHGVVIPS